MSNQTNYKRTVAGSVGAGMGAIFNGSGRTYYILEHKTNSKYHTAGESQKIIIDQVELGRDSSCQVRFDESFDTVSRKHAAIVRDGNNWELVHLSTSNPTLVNGRPIQGHYYLQSGDEIQLSVGGPRIGFIQPQGKQGLTSSIRLTERMNLFRQQALRPYRTAIWVLAILLLLTILGLGTWNYLLNKDLKDSVAQVEQLIQEREDIDREIAEMKASANVDQEKIAQLEKRRAQVVYQTRTIIQEVEKEDKSKADELNNKLGDDKASETVSKNDDASKQNAGPEGKDDIRAYYGSMYRVLVDNVTINDRNGKELPLNMNVRNINCGMGFITPNGTFVTARQNIQPWIYVDNNTPAGDWRRRLALLHRLGFSIKINYAAYSTEGAAQKLTFADNDFNMPIEGDVIATKLTLTEAEIEYLEGLDEDYEYNSDLIEDEEFEIKHITSSARAYALLPGTGRPGIPTDNGASTSMAGGTSLGVVYYTSNNVQNLAGSADYYTATTRAADTNGGTIWLQSAPGASAYGAPVFLREENGTHAVVGVFVGNNRVVPISYCR